MVLTTNGNGREELNPKPLCGKVLMEKHDNGCSRHTFRHYWGWVAIAVIMVVASSRNCPYSSSKNHQVI